MNCVRLNKTYNISFTEIIQKKKLFCLVSYSNSYFDFEISILRIEAFVGTKCTMGEFAILYLNVYTQIYGSMYHPHNRN